MGYDTAVACTQVLSALYRRAYNEGRVVVTRNRLVRASCLFRVIHLRSQALDDQLRQLLRELPLTLEEARTFTRCDLCNVALEPAGHDAVKARVPPYVFRTQRAFHACPSCRRIYWAATHCDRIQRRFARLRSRAHG